jgi:outer membrane immunogenic protein
LSFVNPGNRANIGVFLTAGEFLPGTTTGNLFPGLNPNGVFGGGQIGYDQQFGAWVLGVVADIQASDFKASGLITTPATTTGANLDESLAAKIDWFGTVRGKVGFAANDWLFYGTGRSRLRRNEEHHWFRLYARWRRLRWHCFGRQRIGDQGGLGGGCWRREGVW